MRIHMERTREKPDWNPTLSACWPYERVDSMQKAGLPSLTDDGRKIRMRYENGRKRLSHPLYLRE